MSYDLTLFRLPEGMEPSEAYQGLMDREEQRIAEPADWHQPPLSEAARAEMRRIADAVKLWRPSLDEFTPQSLPWIELKDLELYVQINIGEETVQIEMPYFGDNARAKMECAVGCIETVFNATGYSAYDPQADTFVTAADLERMIALYDSIDPTALSVPSTTTTQSARPWWKFW
jgi:hypothetical protein